MEEPNSTAALKIIMFLCCNVFKVLKPSVYSQVKMYTKIFFSKLVYKITLL